MFLASVNGKVTVLKAGREWEVLGVNDLGDEIHATPALSGGRIYVRTRGTLYCFGARQELTGRPRSAAARDRGGPDAQPSTRIDRDRLVLAASSNLRAEGLGAVQDAGATGSLRGSPRRLRRKIGPGTHAYSARTWRSYSSKRSTGAPRIAQIDVHEERRVRRGRRRIVPGRQNQTSRPAPGLTADSPAPSAFRAGERRALRFVVRAARVVDGVVEPQRELHLVDVLGQRRVRRRAARSTHRDAATVW